MPPIEKTYESLESIDQKALIEETLDRLIPSAETPPAPLHRAMRYAVFSGGKRLRPQLLLKVAQVCGMRQQRFELALRAACALEIVHAASQVHDDLPCFDDVSERRGRPTVHVLFGEATALQVGHALLSSSFEILTHGPRTLEARALRVMRILTAATGSRSGLLGGQWLDLERPDARDTWRSPEPIERYHGGKTGALFSVAAEAAALIAGAPDPQAWAAIGQLVGKGYQLAHVLTGLQQRVAAPGTEVLEFSQSTGGSLSMLMRGEESIRSQLQALLAELHSRIPPLGTQPEPLLQFLDSLCAPLLRPSAITVEDSPALPPSGILLGSALRAKA